MSVSNQIPISTGRTLGHAVSAVLGLCFVVGLALVFFQPSANRPETEEPSSDWPMWRYDAARTGESPHSLPVRLRLQWVRHLPPPRPAWPPEQLKLQFDRSYEPVVMGRQIFVPSMVRDTVTAYDTRTGRENWHFRADGPVRFAPIAWQDKVYFTSDDGFLYCLKAETGRLVWRVRLAPSDRKVFGNGRLISAWPARGAPVLVDGTIYCAAGIWPFMGVFLYAIDAETGRVLWENSGTGAIYIRQQHSSPAFAGVAPQGYLAAAAGKLLVTSRTIPACFDLDTGELLYYHLSDRTYGKYVGGYSVSAWKDWYFNNEVAYRLSDGLGLARIAPQVMTQETIIGIDVDGTVAACELAEVEKREGKDKKVKTELQASLSWRAQTEPALDRIHIKAGTRLYGSNRQGGVVALEIPLEGQDARVVWQDEVEGTVWTMLAGDHRLFVVTEEGRLYCFGSQWVHPRTRQDRYRSLRAAPPRRRHRIERILERSRETEGYCLWFAPGRGRRLREAVRQSDLRFIAVEPDARNVAALREEFARADLYGPRVAVLRGDMASAAIPPYAAALVVVEDLEKAGVGSVDQVYNLLRPYTGVAWIAADPRQQLVLYKQLANACLPGCRVDDADRALVLNRTGPPPGSDDWTHQYGDVANTTCSDDQLKLPLGILWFGDESSFGDVLPRHAHGPPEQVVGGRLFIEGIDSLSARDVYTGRTLWKKTLKGLENFGVYYDHTYKHDFRDLSYNQVHIPGANVRGTNFVATAECVYVIQENECYVLDARSGRTRDIFALPHKPGDDPNDWGYLGIYEDYLIAGSGFAAYSTLLDEEGRKRAKWPSFLDRSASEHLVVMNRHTGRVLWTRAAACGFLHNGIAIGDGKIFCLDTAPPYVRRKFAEADRSDRLNERLIALDIRDGQTLWTDHDCAFGSWLSYSEPFDILIQAHRQSRDMLWEPGDRMAAFRGQTGELIWDKEIDHSGPCMLRDGMILTQNSAYSLITGRQRTYEHPLTGTSIPWTYSRNHGCGTAIASQNLLTFRSAAAGYYDLAGDGGTGNFGGFRSGCTSNLVVANGVLNAPDYTSTCTCSYQNQTSLAMIHMPDVEMWMFSRLKTGGGPIRRAGLNLGAPGDRKADNGTLWLEYPSVGGASPELDVALTPEKPTWFRRHSLTLQAGALKWVEASGARGLRSIRIRVSGLRRERDDKKTPEEPNRPARSYTIRLHFSEPDGKGPGQRLFDVALNEQTVQEDFDIAAEAGAPKTGIVKEFQGVRATDFVTISLTPADTTEETILCGVEIIDENAP